jgi:hypothetical protein
VYITDSTPSTKAVNKHVNFQTLVMPLLSHSAFFSSAKVEPPPPTSSRHQTNPESTKINIKLNKKEKREEKKMERENIKTGTCADGIFKNPAK